MGIKIHRAIGWGMSWQDFHTHVRLKGHPASPLYSDDWFMFFEDSLADLSELMEFVGDGDDVSNVMFWPSKGWKGDWRRQDDPIDYAFERGDADDIPVARMEYLDEPHHPFRNVRMNGLGEEVSLPRADEGYLSDYYSSRNATLLPGIPRDLRKWIIDAGLFDLSGIALLRPLRAQWWC